MPAPHSFVLRWEGGFYRTHSFSHVNRELCRALIERGHEVSLLPSDAPEPDGLQLLTTLGARLQWPLKRPVDACVRQQWPPVFVAPEAGHWVLMQPWEYGSLPRDWIEPICSAVDEVWVPSGFVRNCYVRSGVPTERVQVVPLGVDPGRFHPQVAPFQLQTTRRFKFLFVGGTIHRKGFDVLLQAYGQTFTRSDDVCLVVKDQGTGSFYRGQTAGELIARHRDAANAPEIEYLDQDLSDAELAGLYAACDCLVHPYRGEGFGLPIAEAMATGLPVIVTGAGAALDFCDETTGYLLPAQVRRFARPQVGPLATVDYPWLAEPDVQALQRYLLHVLAHPEEAKGKGAAGAERICHRFTWSHAAEVVEQRLEALLQKPIRRFAASKPSSGAPTTIRPQPCAQPGPAETPPDENTLTSIVVPCCNALEYTQLCLESVLRCTQANYELVLVDNGSTDGTAAYLESWQSRLGRRLGPIRVEVVRNTENRGFAAAGNQGAAHARGPFLVFLSNDTLVTDGWLTCLTRCVRHRWPEAGLVGPVTNWPPPAPQQVPIDYRDLKDLPAFGACRHREHRGRAQEVSRLSAFCLLARREIFEQVGGFDERFGLRYFEDDDLCLRVRQAGYQLRLVLDSFVHHFGYRTFQALRTDHRQQWRRNYEVFQAKWGAHPEVLSVPSDNAGTVPPKRPRVSLCMIVKNEAERLPTCLASVADLVDEIVIVDTGSTDNTRAVAGQFGARVVDYRWQDDFSAARNTSIDQATGDWIFWVDGDEHLDDENRRKLRALFAQLRAEKVAYLMRQLSASEAAKASAVAVDQVRLFRKDPALRWRYRVHEQLLLAVREAGHTVCQTDIVITHDGYREPQLSRHKLERNLRLLHLQDAEQPNDPITLYQLGLAYNQGGQPTAALRCLRRSLELTPAEYSTRPKLYSSLCRGHQQLGQADEALQVCREGRQHYPRDAELLFLEALLLHERGDHDGAEAALVQLLKATPGTCFSGTDAGLHTYKARSLLAEVYRQEGRLPEAESVWRKVLAENPHFRPAWLGLAELYLAQRRWPELEQALGYVGAEEALAAGLLQARACMAREEWSAARDVLEAVCGQHPNAIQARLLLSRVFLQQGQDQDAEKTLRQVLALDPGQKEARKRLDQLMGTQGK